MRRWLLVGLALLLLGGLERNSAQVVRSEGTGPLDGRVVPAYREAIGIVNAYSVDAYRNDPRLLGNYLAYFIGRFVHTRTIGVRHPNHPNLAYDGTPSCGVDRRFCAEHLCRMNAYVEDSSFDEGGLTIFDSDGQVVGRGTFVGNGGQGCRGRRAPGGDCYVTYEPELPEGLRILPGDRIRDDSTGEERTIDHVRLANLMSFGCMTRQIEEVMVRRGQVARSRLAVGGYKPWGWYPWSAEQFPGSEITEPIWQDVDHDGVVDPGENVAFDPAWALTVDGREHEAQTAYWREAGWEVVRKRRWDDDWVDENFDACCYRSSLACTGEARCPVAEAVPSGRSRTVLPTILVLDLCDADARRWAVWRGIRIMEAMQLETMSHGMKQGWFRVTGPSGPKTENGCAHTVRNRAPYDAWAYAGPAHPALHRRGRACPGPFHDVGDAAKVERAYARSGSQSWTHCMNEYFRDFLREIRDEGHGEEASVPWAIGQNSRVACCETRQGILQADVLSDPLWVGEFAGRMGIAH